MKKRKFHLTVDERLMLHLSSYSVLDDQLEMPFALTQQGIADAIMVLRSAVPRSIKALESKGLVEERLAHVRGASRRRKVYLLTRDGRLHINELIEKILEQKVTFIDDDGDDQLIRIRDLNDRLDTKYPVLTIVTNIEKDGTLRIEDLREPNRKEEEEEEEEEEEKPKEPKKEKAAAPMVEYLLHAPRVSYFEGRNPEISEAFARLTGGCKVVVIYGIAGMGKTTMAAKIMEKMKGQRSIFWYRFHEWDSLRNLLLHLGRFLDKSGDKKLLEFLERTPTTNVGEAITMLEDSLAKMKVALFFDDVQKGGNEVLSFFRALIPMVEAAPDIWMVVTSRDSTPFYDRREVLVKKTVHEMELKGLDMESSFMILRTRGIEEETFHEIYNVTNGHPLSLELVESALEKIDTTNFTKYMQEEVFSHLERNQRSLLGLASVFRYPAPKDALLGFDPDIDIAVLSEMVQRTFLNQSDEGYDIHDLLKDFIKTYFSEEELRKYHGHVAKYYTYSIDEIKKQYKDLSQVCDESQFHDLQSDNQDVKDDEASCTMELVYHTSYCGEMDQIIDMLTGKGAMLLDNGMSLQLLEVLEPMAPQLTEDRHKFIFNSIKAQCHHDLGEYSLAKESYRDSIGGAQASELADLTEMYSDLMAEDCHGRRLSPLYLALRYGQLLERENDIEGSGNVFNNVYAILKDEKAAQIIKDDPCLMLNVTGLLGWNSWKLNDAARAGELFEECLVTAGKLPNLPGMAKMSMERYQNAIEDGNLDIAMSSMDDFLDILKKNRGYEAEAAVLGAIEDVLVRSLLTRYTAKMLEE